MLQCIIAGEPHGNQMGNDTRYSAKLNEESFLNEVFGDISQDQVSKANDENDRITVKRQSNSENGQRNEVLNDNPNQVFDSFEEEKKVKSVVPHNDLSYNHGKNIANDSLEANVVASNTIESDEKVILKKLTNNQKENAALDDAEVHDSNKTIEEEYHLDKSNMLVISKIKNDNDEKDNFISEEEEILDSKPESYSTSTNPELHKPLVTTKKESLNEIENGRLQRNPEEDGMNSKNVKESPKSISNTKMQSNIQSPAHTKSESAIRRLNATPARESAKSNELKKDSIPILLNQRQRAKRSTKDLFMKLKTLIRQLYTILYIM